MNSNFEKEVLNYLWETNKRVEKLSCEEREIIALEKVPGIVTGKQKQ